MGTLDISVWGGGGGGVIGFCYISIVLCWVSFFSHFLLYFRSVCAVFSLCVFFYGRPIFFFCFHVSSHWESPVLEYIDVESV